MSTRNYLELSGYKVNCLLEVGLALRQLNSSIKRGHKEQEKVEEIK